MEILKLESITKTYKKSGVEVIALNNLTLKIEKGEFTAIMGPSGSGKTTLLNIIGCLDTPDSGNAIYDGESLIGKDDKFLAEYRKTRLGFIFQSYNLIPVLTVKENVSLTMIIEHNFSKESIDKSVEEILEKVGIASMASRYPRELSGGQEQRVAIARALVKKPILVLADEPTANLDTKTALEIIDLMKDLNKNYGTTFVFSTHDPRMEAHAKRVVVLEDGKIKSDIIR